MFDFRLRRPACVAFLWALATGLLAAPSLAQSRTPGKPARAGKKPAAASAAAAGRFRALAPGVEVTIPADNDAGATFSRHDMVEVLAADPQYGERPYSQGRSPAKNVVFTRNIWCLELSFKPMRMIDVDLPTVEGRFERKQIWYLLFRVKNTGTEVDRSTSEQGEVQSQVVEAQKPLRFIPRIWLESWDTGKSYPDRLLPVAIAAIEKREDATLRLTNAKDVLPEAPSRLLNTVEMEREIPPSPKGQDLGIWGVATWEDIHPDTDHFSVYIQGLTNAYQWEDAKEGGPAAYKKGDPLLKGRTFQQKTLRLNFWRPSDAYFEHEGEIRFGFYEHPGIERFNLKPEEQVDYLWTYR